MNIDELKNKLEEAGVPSSIAMRAAREAVKEDLSRLDDFLKKLTSWAPLITQIIKEVLPHLFK